eukprot:7086812-Prymnesium_polylepis.1
MRKRREKETSFLQKLEAVAPWVASGITVACVGAVLGGFIITQEQYVDATAKTLSDFRARQSEFFALHLSNMIRPAYEQVTLLWHRLGVQTAFTMSPASFAAHPNDVVKESWPVLATDGGILGVLIGVGDAALGVDSDGSACDEFVARKLLPRTTPHAR